MEMAKFSLKPKNYIYTHIYIYVCVCVCTLDVSLVTLSSLHTLFFKRCKLFLLLFLTLKIDHEFYLRLSTIMFTLSLVALHVSSVFNNECH